MIATAGEGISVGEQLDAAVQQLAAAGVAEARADAEVLLAHVLETNRATLMLLARQVMAPAARQRYAAAVARRRRREPVFQVVGEREFWSLPFAVDRRVLTPRPETELLVEIAARLAPGARRVLDLGTGSGCIAIALAQVLPAARIWAVDREADALAVARTNRDRHAPQVALVRGHWAEAFRAGSIDLIVANPPYVAEPVLALLDPEVRDFEPRTALAAGPDGLAAVDAVLATAPRVLAPGGWLVMEIGADQGLAVKRRAGLVPDVDEVRLLPDHAGLDRVVAVRRRGD